MDACNTLERMIRPQDSDKWILHYLWDSVNPLLNQDKDLKPATEVEYLEKVENYPEGDFIGKVRDVANAGESSATRWGSFFSNSTYSIFLRLQCSDYFPYLDVFYNIQEDQTLYATESSLRGV